MLAWCLAAPPRTDTQTGQLPHLRPPQQSTLSRFSSASQEYSGPAGSCVAHSWLCNCTLDHIQCLPEAVGTHSQPPDSDLPVQQHPFASLRMKLWGY
mmetsp:Transcript_17053/g.50907  ORF Transcript_17053/g.50907 Transcript_17053/m.50907 type:complete len:97 (+) Transcript_17053:751-1041(+)